MSNMRQKDLRPAPALIEFKGMKFLITDRPSDVTIHHYITELKKNNVNTVVRVCEPSYNTNELEAQGIIVKDLAFEDGTFPPQHVVDEWFEILKQNFTNASNRSTSFFMKNKRFSLRNKTLRKQQHQPADNNSNNNPNTNTNSNSNINSSSNSNRNRNSNANNIIIDNTDNNPNAIRKCISNIASNTINSNIISTTSTNTTINTTTTSNTTSISNINTKYLNHINTKPTTRLITEITDDNNITTTTTTTTNSRYHQNPEACVAVHCVAGLGRAPVLVALALIELGLKYEAAVEMIRDKRRGAINAKQLSYLERYKPKARLKHKNGHKNSCCVQ